MQNIASHHHPSRQARRRVSRSTNQPPSLAEHYLPDFQRAYEHMDRTNPYWHLDVLGALIKSALNSLRYCMESGHDAEVSWANPCLVVHHRVEWNWLSRGMNGVPRGGYLYTIFTPENTVDVPTAQQTVGATLKRCHIAEVLANATNWAWYAQRNHRTQPFVPVELFAKLAAITDAAERRAVWDGWFQPFDLSEPDAAGRNRPMITFHGEANGRHLSLPLVFEIHPLIADYDRREAYHPIVVGFDLGSDDHGAAGGTPDGWSPAERAALWDSLLEQADQLPAFLRAQEARAAGAAGAA